VKGHGLLKNCSAYYTVVQTAGAAGAEARKRAFIISGWFFWGPEIPSFYII
jgi:hypothetical protein